MDDVERVRERIDIVALISEYIPLKKMGRNFKALCPFHSEKTPSFVVSPERQIWHCFGCSKGGDAFSFLMEYENLEFIEALRILAQKTGIELSFSDSVSGLSAKKEKIYVLNKIALDFYHYVLLKHPAGEKALDYLINERKIDKALIGTFKLGFAPKSGKSLCDYLINKKKCNKQDLTEAGLAFLKGKDLFDFFRRRVIFPLFDHRGNVLGFSGRAIDNPPAGGFGGKYINSKETAAYHKGSTFFGLSLAKEEIKKQDRAIVVEGEFDVIALYSQGFKNAVAIKGTALTEDQANLLSRFTQKISLCFDNDKAGYEATKRSLPVLEKKGFAIALIALGDAKDADELIKKDPFAFKKLARESGSVYDYIFSHTFTKLGRESIDGKRQIAQELLPIIHYIENEIVKEHYLKKLSLELDTSYDSLVSELERIAKKEVVEKNMVFEKKDKRERVEILEEYLLALIIQSEDPQKTLNAAQEILQDYNFAVLSYRKLINHLALYCKKKKKFDSKEFLSSIPQELERAFDTCFLLPLPRFEELAKSVREVEKVSRELRALFLKNKIQALANALKNKERTKDNQQIEELEKELSFLISLLPGTLSVIK